jgi:hypothetical protein
MASSNPDFLTQVRQAKDKLVQQFLGHADVTLIDIGYAKGSTQAKQTPVLRIHVKSNQAAAKAKTEGTFPKEIDGIPVVVITGEYHLDA